MAEILLFGALVILAGAVLFRILRPVVTATKTNETIDTHDFRPRDSSGKIIETLAKPEMPNNSAHPSHGYLQNIEARLQENGNDLRKLDLPERNVFLAHRFDEHLQNEGLIGFLREFPKEDWWEQAKDALYIVRADEYYSVFSEFLETDGPLSAEAVSGDRLDQFQFSDDWNSRLLSSRMGAPIEERSSYMERRLDFYCAENQEE